MITKYTIHLHPPGLAVQWQFPRCLEVGMLIHPYPIVDYAYLTTAYIYNNVFHHNGGGIRVADNNTRGGHGGNHYYWHNTFYGNTDPTQREFSIGDIDNLTWVNNIVYTIVSCSQHRYKRNIHPK